MNSLETTNKIGDLDIAVIGMSGRFPQAQNLDAFWHNLRDGIESISFFSDQELESVGVDSTVLNDPHYVKANTVLEDIELFDASFFDYSPKTAEIMDPQHRLFLETAWEALENAGYNSKTSESRISVYGSASISSYFLFNLFSNTELIKLVGLDQIRHNNRTDNLTTRVAYKLDLKGSAITVQTGCSSSLVAVHLACQSLIDRECDMTLAGGVSVTVLQKAGYFYQEGGILSPDGHCRAFDAQAKGTVSGDGVGIVVLKRLADALADGDCIHAVIKGSAINNDGSSKVGYTAPSIDGQARVIAEALAVAQVKSEMVSYVEAHGTGTLLGDPIEIAALTKSFGATTDKKGFCAIGSVKTNIGHLDTAAGVTGLIKTILALKHQQIPPSLHFKQPNPQIDFANSPFYVNDKLSEWKSNGDPRYAGVSSFGIGGTNAHIILEEAPDVKPSNFGRIQKLLVISAKTSSALETATKNLVKHLQQHPELNLADVAYTLGVGRRAFDHRRIVVSQDLNDTVKILEKKDPQRVFTHFQEPCEREVVFMFPGQGSQYVEMGRELYQTEPIFREQVDYCCEILIPVLGLDLRAILYPSEEQTQQAAQELTQTYITQPALFVTEYALAKLWMAWGVCPEAMIGHSIGEYVAACLAGVFSLEDALVIVTKRGQMMQQQPPGAMLAIPLPKTEVMPLLGEKLSVAAINAPGRCVVSGLIPVIDDLENRLTEQGIDCRRLHTSHAFHSQMMDSIVEPFTKLLEKISLNSPKIPFLSNLTGTWITAAEAIDPTYWAKHLRSPVYFAQGITELLKQPNQIFLEVGPGHTLSTLNKQQKQGQFVLGSIRHNLDQQSDVAFLLNTLGQLWLYGVQVNWSGFYGNERRHRLPLPTYPFERKRYWVESSKISDRKRSHKNEFQQNLNSRTDISTEQTKVPKPSLIETPDEFISIGDIQEEKSLPSNVIEPIINQPLEIISQQLDVLQKIMSQQLDLLRQASVPTKTLPSLEVIQSAPTHPEEQQVAPTFVNASMSGATESTDLPLELIKSNSDEQTKIKKINFTTSAASLQIEQGSIAVLSPCQQQHLNALIARFVQRTQESKRLTQAYRSYHANSRAVTGFLPSTKEMLYPIHGQRGEGARFWDVDDNEYLDISMGFGALLFGHSPPFVIQAIQQQIQQGILHGPQSRLSGQVAELICELTGAERAAFCNDGTEAVMGAIRLARAATGRSKIALFAGSYHGIYDGVLVRGVTTNEGTQRSISKTVGIPSYIANDVIVLDYGNPESLEILKVHTHELAAVLVEPIQSSRPDLQPKEFLHQLRQLTKETGIVLIFDEVITGFRMHSGGIQALWGIQADITTYGKAIGGGMPIGVVAGKASFMDALDGGMWNYGDASYPQVKTTLFAGTFFKHPLVMTAAWATLNYIKNSGPKLQEELTQKTTRLAETLNSYFEQKQVPIRVVHFGSLFRFIPTTNLKLQNLFFYHLLEKGIYVWEGGTLYLSTAHTDEDIEQVILAVKKSVVEMQEGEFLPLSPTSTNDSWSIMEQSVGNTNVTYRYEIEQTIADIWKQLLGIEKMSIHQNFFELGGDSVTGIQFISLLNQKLNIKMAVESLYEGPTINALLKIICPEPDEIPTFEQSSSRGERRREKNRRQQ